MKDLKYMVGTMIEIPRAALLADQVAREAEFFSFGTNDLTQTTMGLSRDDYTKFSKEYGEEDLQGRPVWRARSGRRGHAGEDGPSRKAGRPARPRNRHLWRAWRRTEFGGVLLPHRHELRVLLPVPGAHRASGRRPGGDHEGRRQRGQPHRISVPFRTATVTERPASREAGPQGPGFLHRSVSSGLPGRLLAGVPFRTATVTERPAFREARAARSGPFTSQCFQRIAKPPPGRRAVPNRDGDGAASIARSRATRSGLFTSQCFQRIARPPPGSRNYLSCNSF